MTPSSSNPRNPKDPQELRETLKGEVDQAEWAWLARHAERDAVIVVAAGMDLVEVGVRIARDDAATVAGWIASCKISKPTREQLDAWNAQPDRRFWSLVVQPYVLVQEAVH